MLTFPFLGKWSRRLSNPNEQVEMSCDGRTCRLIDPPVGIAEITRVYGDIRKYIRDDGTLSPEWEKQCLAYVYPKFEMVLAWDTSIKLRRIRCHIAIQELLQHVLDRIYERNLGSKVRHFGGCFNFRPQRGSNKLSTHAWGVAVDLEPMENRLGTQGAMNPGIVGEFEKHGWTWGGRFHRPDPMHFQFAKAY